MKIFDFHGHPSFKPLNSKNFKTGEIPDNDLWSERFKKKEDEVFIAKAVESELCFTSQSHFNALKEGNVGCICVSLYPLERGFCRPLMGVEEKRRIQFTLGFIEGDAILDPTFKFIVGEVREDIFRAIGFVTGFDKERVEEINEGKLQYFTLLQDEYKLLKVNQVNASDYVSYPYKIANSYNEVKQLTDQNDLAVIISLEGAHSFACAEMEDGAVKDMLDHDNAQDQQFKDFVKIHLDNIISSKLWDHPPFVVTFAHHFYNHFCGHAPSLGRLGSVLNQQGNIRIENGTTSIDFFKLGFRKEGLNILKALLERQEKNGKKLRRILIDTKHMSVQTRYEYARYVEAARASNDHIPILQTHTAVSGRTFTDFSSKDGINKEFDTDFVKSSVFNPSSINLYDEEIIDIINSDGLMGIMLDEKRIVGGDLPEEGLLLAANLRNRRFRPAKKFVRTKVKLRRTRKKIARIKEKMQAGSQSNYLRNRLQKLEEKMLQEQADVKPIFLSILFNQFFYIAKTYKEQLESKGISNPNDLRKAWNHICIGSDYEGVINPVDVYFQASDLKSLYSDLLDFWKVSILNPNPVYNKYRDYLFGATPEELLQNILWNNSMSFLKKYFNDKYLIEGIIEE